MPVGPSEIDALMQESRSPLVLGRSVRYIDQKLNDSEFIRDWRHGAPGSYWWDVILHNELTEAEQARIITLYTDAGWKKVECKNSSENDDRPGLCIVTLYK
jgi:hypothetical protein